MTMLLWNDNKFRNGNREIGSLEWPSVLATVPLLLPIQVHQCELTIKRGGNLKALQTLRTHHVSVSINFLIIIIIPRADLLILARLRSVPKPNRKIKFNNNY